MADEGVDAEVQVIEGNPTPPKEKGSSMIFILMVMSVLMMILTPTIVFVVFYHMKPEAKEVTEKKTSIVVTLPKIQVNVSKTRGTKYLEAIVAFTITNDKLKDYFAKQSDQNKSGKQLVIQSKVNEILSSKSLDELDSYEGKEKLKGEIRSAVLEILDKTNADIQDVFFPRFLIQ